MTAVEADGSRPRETGWLVLRASDGWNTGLEAADLLPLHGHRALRKLNLEGLRLSEDGALTLATIRGLQWVMIESSSDLDDRARALLRKALPDAELHIGG